MSSISLEIEALIAELRENDGEEQIALPVVADKSESNGSVGHVERLVSRLSLQSLSVTDRAQQDLPALQLCGDGAYLVTGGLGALGLACARFLVEEGARYLVLNSRRGAYTAEQGRVLDDLARGARIEILEADVADTLRSKRLYTARSRRWHNPPQHPYAPRIIHAAGVSGGSAPLAATNSAALTEVLRAKVAGAWAMHQLSLRAPDLQTFICFSSVASVWGSKGQGPYAAANAFLTRLPAFAIVWVFPPSASTGVHGRPRRAALCMTKRTDSTGMVTAEISERLSRSGIETLSPALALQTLRLLLQRQPPGLNRFAQYVIAAVRWSRFWNFSNFRRRDHFLNTCGQERASIHFARRRLNPAMRTQCPCCGTLRGTPCSIGCALQLPVSVYSSSRRRFSKRSRPSSDSRSPRLSPLKSVSSS